MANKKTATPVKKPDIKKPDTKKKPVKKGSIYDPGVKCTVHDGIDRSDFTPFGK